MVLDEKKKITATNDTFSIPAINATFSIPAKTETDSKLIFYGLKAGSIIPTYNETEKPINSP